MKTTLMATHKKFKKSKSEDFFFRDSLSLLNKMFLGYESSKQGANVLHLLFLYDLKLYEKSSGEIHLLLDTVKTFSDDIKTVFGLKNKCAILAIKKKKLNT